MVPFGTLLPMLRSDDLRRTIDFYTRVLGFVLEQTWPDEKPTMCWLTSGGTRLMFDADVFPRDTPTGMSGAFRIETGGVRRLHDAIKGRVTVEWGPEVYFYGRREFAVRDPDGYLLIFTEETGDTPTCKA